MKNKIGRLGSIIFIALLGAHIPAMAAEDDAAKLFGALPNFIASAMSPDGRYIALHTVIAAHLL